MIITKTNILCMYILNEIQLIHFKKEKYPIFFKKNSKQKQDKILNFCQTQNKDAGKMCRPWKNVSTEIIELFLKLLIYNIAIL